MICFVRNAGVVNIWTETRYLPVLAHTAVLCSSETGWVQPSYPGWYAYDYQSSDVREVSRRPREGRNYHGLKPRVRDGVKGTNLFDVKMTYDGKE